MTNNNASTIILPKKEYRVLVERAKKYEEIQKLIEGDLFSPPPVKNIKEIMKSFKETGRYGKDFLLSLKRGLKRSSYFK